MNQLPLIPGLDTRDPRVRAFWEFHRDNPHVYSKLRDLALELRHRGHRRYGINGLCEVVRWHHALKTTGEFKLNNNHRPYYARLLMQEPALRGFFSKRTARADEE
jgi:hypothetical protein